MKKFLLSLLLVASASLVFAQQYPCVTDYKINNGGGSTAGCPPAETGYVVTGKVTLTFEFAVDPNNMPKILSAYNITDGVSVLGVKFGPGVLNNNGTVSYCYYSGPNNSNNLMGANTQYRFTVSYNNGTTMCGGDQIPLPVIFKSFNANRKNSSAVNVSWTTASEQNNRGFNVQRNDGNGWKNVAFVFTQSVAGTSSSDLTYEFNDANNLSGVSQYRIQQLDLDGKASFSTIRAIRGEGVAAKLLVYPNPSANGNINLVFDNTNGLHDVIVSDAAGRLVKSFKSIANNVLLIENLKKGFYTLKVTNRTTATSSVEKVVIR